MEQDLLAVLDEELSGLPEKYRMAVVLCELEGRSRKEVARQLRLPEGTLSSRLATARKMLAGRLTRRGLALSSGALAMILSQKTASAAIPTALVISTLQAATLVSTGQASVGSVLSALVAALAKGVLKAMFLNKLKNVTVALLMTCIVGGGLAFSAYLALAGGQLATNKKDPSPGPRVAQEPNKQEGGRNAKDVTKAVDREPIAWGKPHNGLRIGLTPRTLSVRADQKGIGVMVWFENVGKEDVQVQLWNELVSFAGTKEGKPFKVAYQAGSRKAWPAPPPKITLKPGTLARFRLGIPLEGPGGAENFVGLPRPGKGAPLTLAAGWRSTNPAYFPQNPNDKVIESGPIVVELADAVPVAGDLDPIAWGQTQNGLRLGLAPLTLDVRADQKAIEVTVWFENAGKEDVQVQAWDELLSFTGSKGGKAFAVEYRAGARLAWPAPPPKITLKPGMLARLTVAVPFEGPDNNNDFVGLLRPGKGEPLTLTAGWRPGPKAGTIESSRIFVELGAGK